MKWNSDSAKLQVAEMLFEASGCKQRPLTRVGGCCCLGGMAAHLLALTAVECLWWSQSITYLRPALAATFQERHCSFTAARSKHSSADLEA